VSRFISNVLQELIETVQKMEPVLAPNQQSTYSNIAFEILGLVLSNVTGLPYEEYIAASILKPLAMNNTTFSKPQDTVAVLPKGQSQYWDVDEGVLNPYVESWPRAVGLLDGLLLSSS